MNNINRATVKKQARELIKGKVFQLFLVIFIAGLLTGGSSGFGFGFNAKNNDFDSSDENSSYSDEYDYNNDFDSDEFSFDDNYEEDFGFDEFYEEEQQGGEENPIDNFGDNIQGAVSRLEIGSIDDIIGGSDSSSLLFVGTAIFAIIAFIGALVSCVFLPLDVTLSGMFVSFVRRNPAESYNLGKELGTLFRDSFNKNFWKKLGLMLLRGIITFLLSLLFVVPGIVYYYSTYFANQLMCDNPDLSPSEALKLSKRMNKGHQGELFVLNLSFIPWSLLTIITLGFASIYVSPYVMVTDALFYENFRIRALQNGVISQQEITSREAMNNQAEDNYFNGNAYGNPYSDPYPNGYNGQSYNNGNYYSTPQDSYYTPPQSDPNTTQTGEYYQPPADNNDNQETQS